jgi:UDP-2-acetamido-2-deoxy-ribo-hexuluronate aminotransferase
MKSTPEIKMVDLHSQYLRIKNEVDAAMASVLNSTAFIQGPQVAEFARALEMYTGAKHVVTCANGTDALQIAMMALDLQPGDEVILPVHTYVATAEVIALLRLKPVFVDVSEDYFTLDIDQVKSRINARTRAIVPVHLYGQCAPMEVLLLLAKEHNLFVIEDAAQSLGAMYTFSSGIRKSSGTMGIVGCTSFFPSKNLGCFGDGGAMLVNDDALAEKIKMISSHGQKIKYHHDIIGVNSRLDTLQAAVLKVKLNYLTQYEQKRNDAASYYDHELESLTWLKRPIRMPESTHVFHQYTLTIKNGQRDALKNYLEKRGVPTMIYYPVPLHLQTAYRQPGVEEGSFQITERLSKEVISLPIHTEMTEDQLSYICNCLKDFPAHA